MSYQIESESALLDYVDHMIDVANEHEDLLLEVGTFGITTLRDLEPEWLSVDELSYGEELHEMACQMVHTDYVNGKIGWVDDFEWSLLVKDKVLDIVIMDDLSEAGLL